MPYEGSGVAPETDVSAVVGADLARSGQFRTMPVSDMVEKPTRGGEIQFPTWRLLKQDFVVVGHVLDAGGGSYRVEYELFDVARQARLPGLAMAARSSALRAMPPPMAATYYATTPGVTRGLRYTPAHVTAH